MAKITVNINASLIKKEPSGIIWLSNIVSQDLIQLNSVISSGISGINLNDYPALWNILKVNNDSDKVSYSWLIFRERAIIVFRSFDAPLTNHLIFNKDEENKYGKIYLIADYKRFKYEIYSDGILKETVWNPGAVLKDNIVIAKNDGCLDGGRYMKSTILPWEYAGGNTTRGGVYASIGDKYITFYVRKENDRIYARNNKQELILVPTNDSTERGMIFNTCELSSGNYIGQSLIYSDFVIQRVTESLSDSLPKALDNYQDYSFLRGINGEQTYLDFYGNIIDKKVTGQEPIGSKPNITPNPQTVSSERIVEQNVISTTTNTKNQIENTINQLDTPEVKNQIDTITTFNSDLKQTVTLYKSAYENNSNNSSVIEALDTISYIQPFASEFDSNVQTLLLAFSEDGEIDKIKTNIKELDQTSQIKGTFSRSVFVSSKLIKISKSIALLVLIPTIILKLLNSIKKVPNFISQISGNSVLSKVTEVQQMVQLLGKGQTVLDKVPEPTENIKSVSMEQVKQVHPYDIEVIVNGGKDVLQGRTFLIHTTIKDNYNEDPELQYKEVQLRIDSEFEVFFITEYDTDNYGKETSLGKFIIKQHNTSNDFYTKWNMIGNKFKIRIKRLSGDYIYNKDSGFFNVVEPVKFDISVPNSILTNEVVTVNFKAKLNID